MNREGIFMFVRYDKFSGCANAMKAVGIYTLTIGSPNTAISAEPSDGIICTGNSSTLTLSAAGPSTKYKYQWYKDGMVISGAINQTYQTTEAGKYTVKVTHRATGCEATTPDADAVKATIDNQAPTIGTIASQSATAAGSCTFTVPDLKDTTLANSNDDHDSTVTFVSQSPAAGDTITANTNVTVTVKDDCGNEASRTVNVTIPAALTVTTTLVDTIDCFGQTATVSVKAIGGTGSYSYSIDGNDWQTSDTLRGIARGSHTFFAKDGNGCTAKSTRSIDAPAVDLTVGVRVDNETCAGNDGAVTLTVSGGTPGYTYQWKKNGTDHATTQDLSNVEADTYTVVVTDSKGCLKSDTATVGLTNNLTVTYPTNAALCSGAELNIVPSASHTVTYTWNAPTATGITGAVAGDSATAIHADTLVNSTTEAQTITYQVTAMTSNGKCTFSEKDVPVTVYAPVSGGTIYGDTIICSYRDNDGTFHYKSLELTNVQYATGGAPLGTYSWTKNGTAIQDANNPSYTPGEIEDGTYSFTRIYNNECGIQSSNTVDVEVVDAGTIAPGSICNTAGACDVQLCSNVPLATH